MEGNPIDLRGTFIAVIDALEETATTHAFIGALPVLAWGRVRATTDIDLVVAVESDGWRHIVDALACRGLTQRRQVGPADPDNELPDIVFFSSSVDGPVRVDVFIAKTDFEQAVIETACQARALGVRVTLARPEASIIYKLIASRPRDLSDVESIFAARHAAGDPLDWGFIDHWAEQWGIEDRIVPYRERYGRRQGR